MTLRYLPAHYVCQPRRLRVSFILTYTPHEFLLISAHVGISSKSNAKYRIAHYSAVPLPTLLARQSLAPVPPKSIHQILQDSASISVNGDLSLLLSCFFARSTSLQLLLLIPQEPLTCGGHEYGLVCSSTYFTSYEHPNIETQSTDRE